MQTAIRLTQLVTIVLLLTSPTMVFAQQAQSSQQAPPPTEVTVETLKPHTVTLSTTMPGRIVAYAESEVRPQVNGIILQRTFEEGSSVVEGDSLFQIDPETYEAAVAQAKAAVQQAQVEYDNAVVETNRLIELQSRDVVSQSSLDDAQAARDSSQAALQLAQALLQQSQIELDHTTIRARLSGEIGIAQTTQGALVTASQTEPLAYIRKIDPIYVDVTQSAADLLRWRRGEGVEVSSDTDKTVELILADGSVYDKTGTLTAAEPYVDPQTGVVTLRMVFDNPDRFLLPGMYVQVRMPTVEAKDVFLLPQRSVIRDRRGRPMAWIVNKDNVVEERQLTILQDQGTNWVVNSGVTEGEKIIVAGFQKTHPGATVKPEEKPDKPAETTANAGGGSSASATTPTAN